MKISTKKRWGFWWGIFFCLLIAAGGVLSGSFIYNRQQARLASLAAEGEDLQRKLAANAAFTARQPDLAAYEAALTEQEQRLLRQLPDEPVNDAALLAQINGIARAAGVKLRKVAIGARERREQYIEIPFDVAVNGDYGQLLAFFKALEELAMFNRVDKAAVTRAEMGLDCNFLLKFYALPK